MSANRTFIDGDALYVKTMSGKAVLIATCGPIERRAALIGMGLKASIADAITAGLLVRTDITGRAWDLRGDDGTAAG